MGFPRKWVRLWEQARAYGVNVVGAKGLYLALAGIWAMLTGGAFGLVWAWLTGLHWIPMTLIGSGVPMTVAGAMLLVGQRLLRPPFKVSGDIVATVKEPYELADGFPEKASGAFCLHNVEITRPKRDGEKLAIGFGGHIVYQTEAGPEHRLKLRSGAVWWYSTGHLRFTKAPVVLGTEVLNLGTLAFALTKEEYETMLEWPSYVAIRLHAFDVMSAWEQWVDVQLPANPPKLPQPKLPF